MSNPRTRSTTVVTARRGEQVAMAADGQITIGATCVKGDAVKVRTIPDVGVGRSGVIVGFAGSAADALALLERFQSQLQSSPTNLLRAATELAKAWRTDRALRRLESLLLVADSVQTFMISGQGDVIEPSDGTAAIGSGGSYALAAARALLLHTPLDASAVCHESLEIAAGICIYTNDAIRVETIGSVSDAP